MTLDTCSLVVDVCCGFKLHYRLDVAVSLLLMFVVVVGFFIFSMFLSLRLVWVLDSLSSRCCWVLRASLFFRCRCYFVVDVGSGW
jgi:hypothetical protein